jgi:hypothetical protein
MKTSPFTGIPKFRSTINPSRPRIVLKNGKWIEPREFGWMLLLGNARDLARRGFMPRGMK